MSNKKAVLVTGGARGIGLAIASCFHQNGYDVSIVYNTSDVSGLPFSCYKADVSNVDEVNNMMNEIGNIDILINCAGIAHYGLFTDITTEEWDKLFSVNVGGVFNCTKAVLPHMISKKAGAIINISSIWGITGASCEVCYSATKAAVIGFSKALAKEVGPSGIRVNCVAPGAIMTDMLDGFSSEEIAAIVAQTPLNRLGTPQDIANTVLFLAQDSYITGQVISPNGGILI